MAKKPVERMSSMKELVQQLEELKAAGLPDVTLPLSVTDEEDSDWPQAPAATQQMAAPVSDATSGAESATGLMLEVGRIDAHSEMRSPRATPVRLLNVVAALGHCAWHRCDCCGCRLSQRHQ